MHGLDRSQSIMREAHMVSQRWLARLGFDEESLRQRVLGDENYHQYRKLNPCVQQCCP